MAGLFSDTALFPTGKKQRLDFALPDAGLVLWEQFFDLELADAYYHCLLSTSPWIQRSRPMYDKMVPDPRLTAYYGGERGHVWTDTLLAIKTRVEAQCGIAFNRVLLSYYRNGRDSVAWHSDTLPADGKHHPIASVSFGDTRIFKVRHRKYPADSSLQAEIPLVHGSFLLMGENMQYFYEHHVPKTTRAVGPRINLTFRISDFITKKSYAPDGSGGYAV
ncbi:alpha-ketoglutarate-dependent dioxygenase AlkB family protein [Sediminibacterium soli]|uniref:alpha-ketoglutarate-dependent dioxygenase AlkB family protein n=1 Tax=Sediminibacterium soli TaxID=2698829 RepID=UPI00137A0830|nr:alpha-ketoglutarate-dependent dioxygenase AlkB [Sediminibacterium soli]NCI46434.1 alpha-ketoglutarate-dependent dioxygenase AlkB [Sediminibacterium soli]